MFLTRIVRNRSTRAVLMALRRTLGLAGSVALLACVPFVASAVPVAHAQPLALQLAAAQPGETARVIVQMVTRDSSVEDLTARLGGTVTQDLHIINAFAATIPAGAIPQLAQAEGVRWVSLDAGMSETVCAACIDTASLENAYNSAIGADRVWNEAPYIQGQGITVAVVDSGVNKHNDIRMRIVTSVDATRMSSTTADNFGHGTHVAGIIGGDGENSDGKYIGVAPKVSLINVKVMSDLGMGLTSDVVAGLQWVYDNSDRYNIRVVNLSMNASVAESYHTSAIDAAIEILWFNGIVVVVSSGNSGDAAIFPPANDPFVITVGAADDRGTKTTGDDRLAGFSTDGTTSDGFVKPDLVAPGTNIISTLASTGSLLSVQHADHRVSGDSTYFRMSGTSMAAPVVSGAVALLLQDEPRLTPDQVKYRLKATARPFGPGSGAGYLDVYAAIHGRTSNSANTGINASRLLWSGNNPITWGSVQWNSVQWNSVQWNSVQWNSVQWNSVQWNSDYWGN